jgi:cytosine deaminase
MTLLLRNALLTDGRTVDVHITDSAIDAVGHALASQASDRVVDLEGMLLLPAPAEPHAHLDKALLADRVPNPRGDLITAIEQIHLAYESITPDDIADRAERAARLNLMHGVTAIRTHVDVNPGNGLRSVEALVEVRRRIGHLIDIEIVALMGRPMTGPDGAPGRRLLRQAIDAGADVVGGCPHLEPECDASVRYFVETAADFGCPLDLHTDETLEASMLTLPALADIVEKVGLQQRATASHCVSLGVQEPHVQESVARRVAEAGVAVVALPQTNLFLQARGHRVAPARGLTAVRPLLDAEVVLAAGADNLQDPFNTMGRGDPLETAALMVMAAHTTPNEAYEMVSGASRRAMGLPVVTIAPGSPAELLAIAAPTLRAAVAGAPMTRLVVHRGKVVSHTVVTVRSET